MKEENKREKLFSLNKMKDSYFTIMIVLFSLQIANFFSVYLFKKSYLSINILLFSLLIFSYLIFKDVLEEKKKKQGMYISLVSIILFVLSSINYVFISVSNAISESFPERGQSLFQLSYFINIIVLLAMIALFKSKSAKEVIDQVYENSILEKIKILLGKEEEVKPGDIKIGIDKDTRKPVYIPFKDRFLHMLILGATGTGKTSQMFLPMILQDIKSGQGVTVLEPKGDLAEKVFAMAKHFNRKVVYFNPIYPNCPYFNPLYGNEDDVIENMATTFRMLSPDSQTYFKDMNEQLIRNGLKVIKRLYGNKATLIQLQRLVQNKDVGVKMVKQFSRLRPENEAILQENADIVSYFLNDYFQDRSKTYENTSEVRSQLAKLNANRYLRRVLNPPNGENDVDFDRVLEEGTILTISTAQGKLRDLGRYLGYFLILQLQSAVFRRPGTENTRRPHYLFIDEFQVYSNSGFADMLTQGRSYRVASHLATQNRALIGMGAGKEGKDFVELVSTNARNVIIFPGGNAVDAKYYSDWFGEITKKDIQKSISRARFNPLLGFQKIGYSRETLRETEKKEARFSPTDIIYRPSGEITYLIIKNNNIQPPGVARIQYIPSDLNDKLDQMVSEYQKEYLGHELYPEEKVKDDLNEQETDQKIQDIVIDSSDLTNFDDIQPPENNPFVQDIRRNSVSPKDFYRGNEVIDPTEEYVDDIVIEADESPSGKALDESKKMNKELDNFEEIDDLI